MSNVHADQSSRSQTEPGTILNLPPSCLAFPPGCDKYFLVALAVHIPANTNRFAFSTLVIRPLAHFLMCMPPPSPHVRGNTCQSLFFFQHGCPARVNPWQSSEKDKVSGAKKEESLIEVCIRTQNELAGKAGLGVRASRTASQ